MVTRVKVDRSSEVGRPSGVTAFTKAALVVLSMAFLTGCASSGEVFGISDVKPWERGTLAREDMQLITDTMDQSADDHIYFSKEASKGGSGIQGGGCGCN